MGLPCKYLSIVFSKAANHRLGLPRQCTTGYEFPSRRAEKISVVEKMLPQPFIRVHRSFVVSIEKIIKVDKTTVFLPNREVPLGNLYRTQLLQTLSPYMMRKGSDGGPES